MPDFHVHMAGHPPLLLARSRPVLTLGRAEEQDLTIRDPTISRHHARLLWREGGAWLEDLGSRHGCFKNGVRIGIPEPVAPWDRLSLGRLPLTLVALPDPGSADPEVTPLSVALSDLRRWRHSGESLDRFSNWKEALDLLHGFSLDMLADLEPEVLLGDLLEQLFTFLDASRGAVLTRNEAGVLAPLAVRPRESRGGPFSLSPATLEATLSRRAAIVFQEPAAAGEEGRLAETPTTSAMAVPLEHDGQVLGLFYFDASRQRGPFTELDLRFVASLSNLAAAKLLAQRTAGELRRKQELERELQAREAQTQAKGEFLALVSHEIRNPMNIVLGFTYLAQQQALPPKAAEYLEKIERSGRSLMRIVNDTLDFSKLEAGRLALESIRFRPLEVAGEVLDLFAPLAAEKGLALRLEAPEGRPELLGDPLRVGQVLTNLVGNAIKFTDQGEVQVQVRLEQEGPVAGLVRVRFTVRDTGIGIPPGRLAQLFAPYAQGDASMSRRYGGTGLGLAISRRLVEMMGGALTAASTGPGSTFAFTLDLPAAPAPAAGGAPDLRDRRLLLVEDNPLNRQLAGALLAETGARVDAAASGGEALQQLTGGD
jgi:signal transduction histidine kinase